MPKRVPNCRYLAFHGDKMYVSAYVGSVADADLLGSVFEVDTASLEITREVKVGHQPDELVVVDDKLYVVNSGGYLINRYDSTMSVIDLHSFTELRKVVVGLNPTRLRVDDQKHLWVCCQGNYNQTAPQVVVLQNEAVVQLFQYLYSGIDRLRHRQRTEYVKYHFDHRLSTFYVRLPTEPGL